MDGRLLRLHTSSTDTFEALHDGHGPDIAAAPAASGFRTVIHDCDAALTRSAQPSKPAPPRTRRPVDRRSPSPTSRTLDANPTGHEQAADEQEEEIRVTPAQIAQATSRKSAA